MLKGEQYEIIVSTPEKMIDKCYVIMDILSVNINLEKKNNFYNLNKCLYFSLNKPVFGW